MCACYPAVRRLRKENLDPKASLGVASEFKAILGLLRADQKRAIKPWVVGNLYSELVGNWEHLGVSVRRLQRSLAEGRETHLAAERIIPRAELSQYELRQKRKKQALISFCVLTTGGNLSSHLTLPPPVNCALPSCCESN